MRNRKIVKATKKSLTNRRRDNVPSNEQNVGTKGKENE